MTDTDDPPLAFLAEVGRRSRTVDAVLLAVVPAVLVGLHALPSATRAELVYARADPSLLTAFTTHYVHVEPGHLLGNLGVYLLIAPAGYLLFLLSGRRAEFLAVTITVLSVFPFVLTGLDSVVLRRGTLVGFSGLAMAFVGVLPVAMFLFLDERIEPRVGLDDAPVLFFAGLALIALRVLPTSTGLALAVAAGVLAAAYAVRIGLALPRPAEDRLGRLLEHSGYLELAVVSPLLFALAILAAFPADPVRGTTVVDLFGHLLGYTLGFLGTYLTVRLDRAVGGEDDHSDIARPPPSPPPEGGATTPVATDGEPPSDADEPDDRR